MTSTFGIPLSIDGPAPQAPKYGLLAVAYEVPSEDERWANGVDVWPYPPDQAQGHDPCNGGSLAEKAIGGVASKPTFAAFTAYLAATCNARGIATNDEFRQRAVAAFAAVEGAAVERQFASGAYMTLNPYLTDLNLTLPLGTVATSPVNALAVLENQIGATDRAGVIHADPATVTAWASDHLIEPSGTVQYTVGHGTPVAVGDGYIGAHPLGHGEPSACQGWAFATGPVQIRRSNDVIVYGDLAANLDRVNNVVTFRAERNVVVYWDQILQAGVLVDRGVTGCS
jgi:hypothetical protein